ncbi:hypothetical protein H0H81_003144 [Sphagnurus paluster]|uniref:Uncharacterized protein n=1 Tax=Sphagnurus paluster TaxID=117069 RepID=A0A9P7FZQ3_9AGAR|nr:hypothetical protein H0H81_003144 [Sphagnurus paluster]
MDKPPAYIKETPAAAQVSTSTSALPGYAEKNPSPNYVFPQTFPISELCTSAPLVSTVQVKGHLALLHAFAKLRAEIDALDVSAQKRLPLIPPDTERRWTWFVGLAVERCVKIYIP